MFALGTSEWALGLLLILFTSFNLVRPQPPTRTAKFGEVCDDSQICDFDASLSCVKGICGCHKDDMIYDATSESCVLKVGSKCRYQLEPEDNLIGYLPPKHDIDAGYEELTCVPNSYCNRLGVCSCSRYFNDMPDGTCLERGSYLGNCTKDVDCRLDRFLSCVNGLCSCNEASLFCPVQQQCVGKWGQPCVGKNYGCVRSADCSPVPVPIPAHLVGIPPQRKYSVKTCVCQPGYVGDSSGECRVGIGGRCSDESSLLTQCAEFLNCREGECVCPYENLQVVDMVAHTCTSLVGGPCNETVASEIQPRRAYQAQTGPKGQVSWSPRTNRNYNCIPNANCMTINNGEGPLMECACDEGFIQNKDGTCDLAFGSKCTTGSHPQVEYRGGRGQKGRVGAMNKRQNVVCDRTTPLTCLNGFCQCESDFYEYDGVGACLGKHGARCELGLNSTSEKKQLQITKGECIEGAQCIPVREHSWPVGKCECIAGKVNTERKCE